MFENYDVDLGRESFIAAFYWSYDKNGSRIFRFRDTIAASGCILVMVNHCFSAVCNTINLGGMLLHNTVLCFQNLHQTQKCSSIDEY